MKNPAQTGSGCIRFNDIKVENATFAEYSCLHILIFSSETQALVSFKKYMPPPLPYFKVNICPVPLAHFGSIFSLICDPFADPIMVLNSRDISLFDCHI
jgi:hypothetical protein